MSRTVKNCHKSLLSCLLILIVTMATTTGSTLSADQKIEPNLRSKLDKGETVKLMVSFASTSSVLENVTVAPGASRGDRASAVNKALEEWMNHCQAGVVNLLKARNVEFKQFWISNTMAVSQGTKEIAELIAADPEVQGIREEAVAYLLNNDGGQN